MSDSSASSQLPPTDPDAPVSEPFLCESPKAAIDAMADADSRAILAATAEVPLSVSELVDRCEIPSATAYRKVGQLVDAGLLDERIRIRLDGRNTTEYRLHARDIYVGVDEAEAPEIHFSISVIDEEGPKVDVSTVSNTLDR